MAYVAPQTKQVFDNAPFPTSGIAAVSFTERTDEPRVAVGTLVHGTDGGSYRYIKSAAAFAAGATANGVKNTGPAFAAGQYGFVMEV